MARAGTLEIKLLGDTKDLNRALGQAQSSLKSFAKGAGAVFAGAGIIAGGVFAKAFGDALDGEKIEDRLEASLSPTSKIAGEAGEIASRIFAGAWTDSLGEAADAVGIVASTLDQLDARGVEDATQKALDLAYVFEQDVSETVNAVGVLLNTGLVKDADRAFDLITRAFQEVPATMRDELPQILEEYAKDFQGVGISGEEAFALLVDAASSGRFALDKTGDAIKEFSILAAEDGGTAADAFEDIGLDAERMADMVASGGSDAREALGLIVDALLKIEDPSERATKAIEIFGTPIEDLGTENIPEFLRQLDEMPGGMAEVEGAAVRLGDAANDNLKTRWDSALNSAKENLRTWIDRNILPGVEEVVAAFDEDGMGGAISKMVELWEEAQPQINAWFNTTFVPWWEQTAMPVMEDIGEALGGAIMDGMVAAIEASLPSISEWIRTWWKSLFDTGGINPLKGPDATPGEFGVPFPTPSATSGSGSFSSPGTAGTTGGSGFRAHGGNVTRGNWLVGERGPEVVSMPGMGSVRPVAAGATYNVTVNTSGEGNSVADRIVLELREMQLMNNYR